VDVDEELSPPPPHADNSATATIDKPYLRLALENINEVVAFNVIFS
jgi:hypothetical protein